jgi:thiol-disulfide isomerase/thioredoxin
MKFNFLILSLSILLFACGESNTENGESSGSENSVTGVIENGAGKTIFLEGFNMNGTFKLDSVVIEKDGSFKLKAPAKTDFYRLGFDNVNYILLSIDSLDKDVKITANADTLSNGYKVEGSSYSKDILEFVNEQTPYITNRMNILNSFNAGDQNDTAVMNQAQRSIMRLDNAFNTYVIKFVDKHPKSPATFLALSYLDPMMQLDVIKKVEIALSESMYNSPLHVDILNKIGQLESQKQIKDAQLIDQERMMEHLKIGNAAPEINLASHNGGNLSLSSLKGKVVLIDFWASWCGPCRQENPNVVKMYNKYKDKGFTVYSVSLDKDKTKWLNAIQQDGLVWPNHVSDLKFWQSAAAQTYGVTSIPFTVLIGKDGKIIDKNLRGTQLEAKLKEILGS